MGTVTGDKLMIISGEQTEDSNFFQQLISGTFVSLLFIAYVGSLPLALIFGDKWDVVLSLVIPTYGFWVMIHSLLS